MAKAKLDEKIVILGGGLAGLSASLSSGAPIYEAEDKVGGVSASDAVDGFTFDRGIHVLQTSNQRILSLFDAAGVALTSHARRAYIYYRGRYAEYPFQVNTAGLPLQLRIQCVAGFLRRGREPEPDNYEQWIYRSVGKGFAKAFLIPYSEKFWTVHPREMTFEWTGKRVPQPTIWQVLRGAIWSKHTPIGTNVDFRYPIDAGGYGRIAEALSERSGSVHLGHRAVAVDVGERRVHFANGTTARYDTLISSIPLPELILLCVGAPDVVRQAASRLRTNSILVVNLGVGRPDLSSHHWVHFPEKDISFFRISYPHNFSAAVVPRGASSISAEVAYSAGHPFDEEAVVGRVRDDLTRVGILRRNDRVVATTTRNIKYAYCIYDQHRRAALGVIRPWLKDQGIVPCGRYGLWTYFWSHEAILSGLKAGESVRRRSLQSMVPKASSQAGA